MFTAKKPEFFGGYAPREQLVAAYEDPIQIAHILLGYAVLAWKANRHHTAAHALAEAGYGLALLDPALAKALAELSGRAFETDPGHEDCRTAAEALGWLIEYRTRTAGDEGDPAGFNHQMPDIKATVASALMAMASVTGIVLEHKLWISAAATLAGYPEEMRSVPDGRSKAGLNTGGHRKIAVVLARNVEGSATSEELFAEFIRDIAGAADASVAYRESRDLVHSLIALGRPTYAMRTLYEIARDVSGAGDLAEATALARRLTRLVPGDDAKRQADALYAHFLSLGTRFDDLLQSVEVARRRLDADGDRIGDGISQWLMWSTYFSLHQIGFYEAALSWLQRIDPDEDHVSERDLAWAVADLQVHLGFSPTSLEGIRTTREAAVSRRDARRIAEADLLFARIRLYDDDRAAERLMMLAVEGFRRVGARSDQARALSFLGDFWLARGLVEAAAAALGKSLGLFTSLGAGALHMGRIAAFDYGRCLYLLGRCDDDTFERLLNVALDDSDVVLFTTLMLQYAELAVERRPGRVHEMMNTALDLYARWRSFHTLTTWRAGLLAKETKLRSMAIRSSVAAGADPAEAVALIVEGASQSPPKPPPQKVPEATLLAADRMHGQLASPETDERIAEILGDSDSVVVHDPSIHAIPVTQPARITIGASRRTRPFDDSHLRELDIRAVAEGLGYPHWLWWSQWTDGAALYHGFVSSRGDCWHESVDYAVVRDAVTGYISAHPVLRAGAGADEAPDTLRRDIERRLIEPPEAEWHRSTELGHVLLPVTLADHLRELPPGHRPTIIVQPSAFAAEIPLALLRLPGSDLRLVDVADLDYCPHPALFERRGSTVRPGTGTALILDPAGRRLCGSQSFDLPLDGRVEQVFARPDLPGWASRAVGSTPRSADPSTITAALSARPVRRLIYAGHVEAPDAVSPGAGAFVLDGAKITAAEWLQDPDRFPAAEELVLIACSAAGSGAIEPLGLPTAALAAGTDRLVATLSPLLNTVGMWSAARELLGLIDTMRYPAALATLFRRRLHRWRATQDPALHPMQWSPFIAVDRAPGARAETPSAGDAAARQEL
ncbi:CHAT domain-containing protein [Catenulispora rubra]|uniref:CHAT domain-containing protein n=1 Tax=Catenulispora rubra TaxID=280293 RepID=UPI00189238D8|nr:CHAT domain-containing protein [Catenulispora rubra]